MWKRRGLAFRNGPLHRTELDALDGLDGEQAGGSGGKAPEPPTPVLVPEDVLPEQLRGKSPEEVREALNKAFQSTDQLNVLTQRLANLEGRIAAPAPTPTPANPPAPEKPLSELIYEDPEAAIRNTVAKMLGTQINNVNSFMEDTASTLVRQELTDFDQYKDRVDSILNATKAPRTKENLRGAYMMARGEASLDAERRAAAKRIATPEPTVNGNDPKRAKEPKISDLESQVMRQMGITDVKEYLKYRDGDFDVKVPGEQ